MSELADRLGGITTPLVTPFADDDLDEESLDAVLDHVLAGGVDGLFPCGTTGEVASLTTDERLATLERVASRASDDVPVLVGGTGTAVASTREWITAAAAAGADGVVATAPYFHPANDPAGYRDFFAGIADDSPLPILLYNIPACVGEAIPISVVTALADHPNVIGLKDSSGDLTYGMQALDATPAEFLVIQGYDPLVLPSLRLGFDGGINAVSNVVPDAYAAVAADPTGGDARTAHEDAILPLFSLCQEHGFAAGAKAALLSRDVIDTADVRPPLVSVSADAASKPLARARDAIRP